MTMCFFVPRQTQHLHHIVVMAMDPPVQHLLLVRYPEEVPLREMVGSRVDYWGTGDCDKGKNMNMMMCFFVTRETQLSHHIIVMDVTGLAASPVRH
jgi:hypothetical protein